MAVKDSTLRMMRLCPYLFLLCGALLLALNGCSKKADVKSQQHLPTSLMPPGLTMALKPEDVVDLLAYLETLKGQ